jgi:hypothetical protein
MRDFTDYIAAALFSLISLLLIVFIACIIKSEFEETSIEKITLDSGNQCVATVKGNSVTNLDCE